MFTMRASFAALITTLFVSGVMAGGDGGNNNNGGWNNNQPSYPPPPPPPPPPSNPPYPPPPSNPPYPPPSQNIWNNVVQLHPNGNWKKCLDVRGAKYENGTPVDIYDCNGTGAQNWVINPGNTKVQVAGQPFCLDAGEWPNNGSKMKIWTCYDNLPAQNWYYTDDKRIALRDRGFCLDLTNGDTCNGNQIQIWQCTPNDVNQIWTT